MTIKTYRFHARNLYNAWNYAGAVPPALTRQGLVQALAGSAIRELTASTNGGYDAHIELDRDTHHDAVTEIESALMQLAFYTVQAEVTELATATVEGALLGGSAGSALGASTRNLGGLIVGVVIGGAVGAIFGHTAQTIKARYRADRIAPGIWRFTQLPIPQQGFGAQPRGSQS